MMNLFASPLSLIVQSASSPIICSNTPVMFQIKGNEEDQQGTWFCITDKGPHPCQAPLKLAPHSIIWKNMDLGLSWLSPNIYDAKKIHALHHLQNIMNLQKTKHSESVISQNNETEDPTFLNGVKDWRKATKEERLNKLHPGKFSVVNTYTRKALVILFSICLMPVMAYTLVLIIQICMMCFRMGPNLLTVSAVFKSLKSSFTRHNSNMVETIRIQALNEEESH